MAKKKLITLAKELDFTTEQEYFDYMIDTHINGQFVSCANLFYAMSRANQKELIVYIDNSCTDKNIRDYYFNLL